MPCRSMLDENLGLVRQPPWDSWTGPGWKGSTCALWQTDFTIDHDSCVEIGRLNPDKCKGNNTNSFITLYSIYSQDLLTALILETF